MDQEPAEYFAENWRVFESVAAHVRELVGERARYEHDYVHHGRIGVFAAEPVNARASSIGVIAEQFFIITLAGEGRWELGYGDEDVEFAHRLIVAAVDGRVRKRTALGRSLVEVTLEDGSIKSSISYGAGFIVPQPGWTRWGKLTRYEQYSAG